MHISKTVYSRFGEIPLQSCLFITQFKHFCNKYQLCANTPKLILSTNTYIIIRKLDAMKKMNGIF